MTSYELKELQKQREELFNRGLLTRKIKQLIAEQMTEVEGSEFVQDMHSGLADWFEKAHEFSSKTERVHQMYNHVTPVDCITETLKAVAVHTEETTIQAIAATVARELGLIEHFGDEMPAVQITAEMVCFLATLTGLYSIRITDDENGVRVKSHIDLGEEIITRMADLIYMPPMLVPPHQRKANRDSCFYKAHTAAVSDPMAQHDMALDLENLNHAGSVGFRIDVDTFADPHLAKEIDKYDLMNMTPRQIQAHADNHDLKVSNAIRLALELFELDVPFYFGRFYCSRGRQYVAGYHLTTQGDDFEKASLLFDTQEVVEGVPDWAKL